MLYLNPPYYVINEVSLLPDHADPLQWYYMPMAPRLTRVTDPVSSKRIPSIQVIKYRGQAGNGGFLNFDVNLGLDQGELDDVANELKRQARLRDRPKLAPVPLVDGTVKMMLLGTQSGAAPPAAATADTPPVVDAVGPKFVIKIDQHAKPSLYGNNQAAFSVKLDQDSVTVLEKALQGEMSPIGIVYSLEYLALRRAYSIRVHADWNRVQTHLSEKFSVNTPIYSSSIDKTVDKLIDERAIDVQVDTFVPEGEDSGAIIAERDQWVNEVRDMVTDAFFEPSLDPVKEKEDSAAGAASTFGRVLKMIATGGVAGGDPVFQRKKVDYTRIDQKKLDVNMNSRTTVKRNIHPQGHLSGLVRLLKNEGLDIDDFILDVDLDDPWFQRRRVSVISRADFAGDAIESVNVRLRYGQEPKNVILEPGKTPVEVSWGSLFTGGVLQRDVPYTYQVNFKGVDGSERPVKLVSPEAVVDVENLEINPRELYSITPVPIVALNFPWDLYPHVEVQTQYTDEANGIRIEDSFLLDKDNADKTWNVFVRDPRNKRLQFKVIYRAADQKDVVMPWVEADAEQIRLRDPFPSKRTLDIAPVFAWTEVDRAFVDVTYEDPPNAVLESKSFEFSEQHKETQSFSVSLVNKDQRLVSFKVTVIFKDGRIVEIPRSVTLDTRITVTSNMKGRRIVVVRPAPVDFAQKKLKHVRVETRHEDSGAGLSTAAAFEFHSKDDRPEYFEFDYADEKKADYEHRVTYRYLNGLSKSVNWSRTSAEELVIPVA